MAGDVAVLRASVHRLAAYGVTGASLEGWTAVPEDALAGLALTVRTPGCLIRWDPPPSEVESPSVTVFGAAGEVVRLAGDATPELAERAADLLGQPGAGAVLHRALTVDAPFYDASARVGDVCRAVGVPLALVAGTSTEDSAATGSAPADVGFVLLRRDAATAAAESPLTRQSAWIVPLGQGWSLQVWDGQPPRHPLPSAAMSLSQGGFALAVWWGRPPADVSVAVRAGFLLARSGRAVAAHEWSTRIDLGIGHTAATARALTAAFGVPDRSLDVTAVLRRKVRDPLDALLELLALLRVPAVAVGLGQEDLVQMARSAPGAVHAARLSKLCTVLRALGEPATVVDRAARERPPWYRVVNAVIAVVMAFATFVLYVNWRWGTVEWWWVAVGAATTVGFAATARPVRRRR